MPVSAVIVNQTSVLEVIAAWHFRMLELRRLVFTTFFPFLGCFSLSPFHSFSLQADMMDATQSGSFRHEREHLPDTCLLSKCV